MRILIVTHDFFPVQSPRAFRATELAKEFCRQGHEVSVMAPYRNDMEPLLKEFPIVFISLGKLNWKIPNLSGFGRVGGLYNKAVNRLFPLLFEYPMLELYFKVKTTLKKVLTQEFDLLISIAVPYPIHWGVASAWNKKKKNIAKFWVADCGDPYCMQENDTFKPPFYFHWVEKWFMRKADYISIPTINSKAGYFNEFNNKLCVIPQGFKFEEIITRKELNDGVVRFGYGGAFIKERRDPTELLEFLVALPDTYQFEFHIYTKNSHLVEEFAKKDRRIILHPPTSRLIFLEALSSYQFVVNFANKGTTQTPSKLIDYAILEKPILHIETGSLEENTVLEFLEGNYRYAFKIENVQQYRIESVARQFIALAK